MKLFALILPGKRQENHVRRTAETGAVMRLVCPNCGAQYEVDDRVIPEGGRDVQCSNCGHGWFQKHPDQDAELAEELGTVPQIADPQVAEPAPEPEPEPAPEPTPEPEVPLVPEADDDTGDMDEAEAPAATPRELDDGVRDILRQEAEFEMEQRSHEREKLESQPDLGLEDLDPEEARRRTVQERMARLRGLDEMPEEEVEDTGARRDLLPDIEEISSTLDGDGVDVGNLPPDVTVAPAKRGGFRRGFLMMIVLAALVALLYAYAPQLGEAVPALKPTLDSYVVLIDQSRVWLDGMVQSAIGKMQGAAEG